MPEGAGVTTGIDVGKVSTEVVADDSIEDVTVGHASSDFGVPDGSPYHDGSSTRVVLVVYHIKSDRIHLHSAIEYL